jgi:hypothetical protein
MKYLLFFAVLVAAIITAGCVSENQNVVITPIPTTSQIPTTILTIIPQTTVVSPSLQNYKTADLALLNTQPAYGFKMDYPSEWTYKVEHTSNWKAGYNFSSPDAKSNVYVYIDDGAGAGYYYYPLDEITTNTLDKTSWANNVIKANMESYCLDGRGEPVNCGDIYSNYYHRRLITNTTVVLSGNINARKLVFAPDARDTSYWSTYYLMHVGKMQGYNFTIPGHYEVAVKVDGPVWDYGMGGQAYAITLKTPNDQVNATSDIFDHMIKSFEVTGI